MKTVRAFSIVLTLVILVTLAGCNSTFSYSFKREQELGDWIIEEWFDTSSVSSVSPMVFPLHAFVPDKGLELRQGGITYPFMFSGDLTYKVNFHLKADTSHSLFFSISLSDQPCTGDGSDLHLDVIDVGLASEAYALIEHEPSAMIMPSEIDNNLPGLNRDGFNQFILEKTGDLVKMEMNGIPIGSITLVKYASVWFAPNIEVHINGYTPDGVYGLFIDRVEVSYPRGNEEPMILVP